MHRTIQYFLLSMAVFTPVLTGQALARGTVADVTAYGAIPDDDKDDTAAIQKAIAASLAVEVPPGKYRISGTLKLRDHARLVGHAATFVFQGATETSCFQAANDGRRFSHASISGINIDVAAPYRWVFDLPTLAGIKLSDMRITAQDKTTGGIRAHKNHPSDSSWTLSLGHVEIRLPDDSTGRTLDLDVSDSEIIGGAYTGGIGAILRGTGAVRVIGARFDRSTGYGLTLSKETESAGVFQIVGNEIEENSMAGILVTADSKDALKSGNFLPIIVGNQFRNHAGKYDILFENITGPVISGGVIEGNAFSPEVANPISYDPLRWKHLAIGVNTRLNATSAPNFYAGHQFLQPALILAQSARPVVYEGHTIETTLAEIAVPANAMGRNGRLRIRTLWRAKDAALLRIRFGGTAYAQKRIDGTSDVMILETDIANRDATDAQIGGDDGHTGHADTAQDVPLRLTAELKGGGAVTLEDYSVELLRGE